jgi:predicted nucleic acid-binding protein
MVLVDTTVWSLAVRRPRDRLNPHERAVVDAWVSLVTQGIALLVGPIRQEVLSGIRRDQDFRALRTRLSAFPCLPITMEDYDTAAACFNTCRAKGISGIATDMLLCAVAGRHRVPIFTTDPDFQRYARYLPVLLYQPRGSC